LSNQLQVIIVTQNEIEGEGLRRILTERSLDVVGVFRNLADIPLETDSHGVNNLLVMASSSDEATLEMCREAHMLQDEALIVMLGHDCECAMVAQAFQAGVAGYIGKDTSCASLAAMINLVALGEKIVPSRIIFELAGLDTNLRWNDNDGRIEDVKMSDREVEILRGLIRGEPNKIISRRLNITEATVKVHVKSILRKLHVVNRTQAAIWALSRGLLGEPVQQNGEQPPCRAVPAVTPAAVPRLPLRLADLA